MSILIKGMEMPTKCSECLFAKLSPTGESLICNYMLSGVSWDERPFDCPLVPVPPHGDLIDAFAFRREMDTKYPFDKFTQSKHEEADAAKSTILMMLAKAPTIIEAEEGN